MNKNRIIFTFIFLAVFCLSAFEVNAQRATPGYQEDERSGGIDETNPFNNPSTDPVNTFNNGTPPDSSQNSEDTFNQGTPPPASEDPSDYFRNLNPNQQNDPYRPADPQACGEGFGNSFKCAVSFVISLINYVIPLIIGIALVLFLFGLIKYITAGGDETKVKEARSFIIYGVIGLFVMLSVWGLVSILVNTVFPNGGLYIPQVKS
jgi:hypothetical protein